MKLSDTIKFTWKFSKQDILDYEIQKGAAAPNCWCHVDTCKLLPVHREITHPSVIPDLAEVYLGELPIAPWLKKAPVTFLNLLVTNFVNNIAIALKKSAAYFKEEVDGIMPTLLKAGPSSIVNETGSINKDGLPEWLPSVSFYSEFWSNVKSISRLKSKKATDAARQQRIDARERYSAAYASEAAKEEAIWKKEMTEFAASSPFPELKFALDNDMECKGLYLEELLAATLPRYQICLNEDDFHLIEGELPRLAIAALMKETPEVSLDIEPYMNDRDSTPYFGVVFPSFAKDMTCTGTMPVLAIAKIPNQERDPNE